MYVCTYLHRLMPIFGQLRTSYNSKIIATFRPLGLLQASLQNYNVTTELDRCGMITNQSPSVMVRSNQYLHTVYTYHIVYLHTHTHTLTLIDM